MATLENVNKYLQRTEQDGYLQKCTFLDIDGYTDEAMRHFSEHTSDILIRNSVTEDHLHAIVLEPCNMCATFQDTSFSGNLFFNNKGERFVEMQWTHLRDNTHVTFIYNNIIYLMYKTCDNSYQHFYIEMPFFEKYLPKVVEKFSKCAQTGTLLYYTFHSALLKFKEYFEYNIESEAKNIGLEEYIEKYQFKEMATIEIIQKDYRCFQRLLSKVLKEKEALSGFYLPNLDEVYIETEETRKRQELEDQFDKETNKCEKNGKN